MRKRFGEILVTAMSQDERIYLLAGDVGFGVLDAAFKEHPNRCFNMGAAEQVMIGAAVGMTYEHKVPICYTITPFLLYRPYEWLRNYVQIEGAPVKLIGVGRGEDYGHLGYTHWCNEQNAVLATLPRVRTYFPDSPRAVEVMWPWFMEPGPAYMNLRR